LRQLFWDIRVVHWADWQDKLGTGQEILGLGKGGGGQHFEADEGLPAQLGRRLVELLEGSLPQGLDLGLEEGADVGLARTTAGALEGDLVVDEGPDALQRHLAESELGRGAGGRAADVYPAGVLALGFAGNEGGGDGGAGLRDPGVAVSVLRWGDVSRGPQRSTHALDMGDLIR
jgi:hypothetical protein